MLLGQAEAGSKAESRNAAIPPRLRILRRAIQGQIEFAQGIPPTLALLLQYLSRISSDADLDRANRRVVESIHL